MRGSKPLPPLWPDLPPATSASLFYGLHGAPDPPTDPAVWRSELGLISRNRLAGLAIKVIAEAGITLDDDVTEQLRRSQAFSLARVMRLEAAAPRVAELLERQGIRSVFTKGPALARAYADPATRVFSDLDVVVPPERYWDAVATLQAEGFEPNEPIPPRRWFSEKCREATGLGNGELSVDVHHHIPPWVFAERLPFERLWADAIPLKLEAGTVSSPSDEHHLIVALLHLFSHLGRPGREPIVWRDILVLVDVLGDDRVVWALNAAGLAGLGRYAFDSLPAAVRPAVTKRLPRGMRPGLAFRVRQMMPPNIGSGHVLGILFRLPLSNAPAFVASYVFPSREFIRRHVEPGEPATLLRWWRNGIRGYIEFRRSRGIRS